MLALFVVLAVATSATSAQFCCTKENAREVHRMWDHVWSAEATDNRITIAQSVFKHLFANNPSVVSLFGGVNGDDVNSDSFKAHCIRVVNGLDTAINLLDDPATLDFQLKHLNAQHMERTGVKAAHFGAIASSFSKVMPMVTSCFNPVAWDSCFKRIADGISDKMA